MYDVTSLCAVVQLRLDKRLQKVLVASGSGPTSGENNSDVEQDGSGSEGKTDLVKSEKGKADRNKLLKDGDKGSAAQLHQMLHDIQKVFFRFPLKLCKM